MWPRLYRWCIEPGLRLALRVAAIRSSKARRALAGRRGWREQCASLVQRRPGVPRVHVHAASVGEFEQAKPIIESLRERRPGIVITASFYSPSGFEQQRAYPGIDAATYLPSDRPAEMDAFLDRIDPDLVVIVRYDLWPAFLEAARARRIPIVLVAGVLRASSMRLRAPLRSMFRWVYGHLTAAHLVSAEDLDAFVQLAPSVPATVSGDTRYDRVVARAASAAAVDAFGPSLVGGRTVMVAGSTWEPDEDLLVHLVDKPGLLLVVVPHEPTPDHVRVLLRRFADSCTLTSLERDGGSSDVRTVIVDRTGLLAGLYRIGSIAYVGGGFGAGVHSVLEPAAYGLPVICGPRIERSRDAVEMSRVGGLRLVRQRDEIDQAVASLLGSREEQARRGNAARTFVAKRTGATDRIVDALAALLPSENTEPDRT